ncbi:type III restriction enzyme [Cyclonatronum proteinivorum]|uniref:Type III restriction enzyme n=1 Tax=Cyclonatronum proteinivorum TaxID=1457365 RepID=A0A345ULT7_9BACT|nr:DEAD/DEAH box helicase family protein [Cyclonatronum proteinivorum]AXJ01439.1 type III restriction enzyme [Cyclonatronum proteinivorum]
MELKNYQHKVIEDLEDFLEYLREYQTPETAFNQYWEDRIGPYNPIAGIGMEPYKQTIPKAAHVCIKVPTAGGKTFIACHALHSIFNATGDSLPKAVIWLVPWSNLLDQTVHSLSNPDHPYRKKLNALFNHRVEVYTKEDLLQGSNFNPTVVQDQLSIIVMSFASLRARKKEDRKVYQENGQLAAFANQYSDAKHLLHETDETALINVIRSLNPVLVVDESHNAESTLSVDMLGNLNPSFILDLTATPKINSNIVSLVPAIELKKEHMVKLPVIVYNHQDKTDVINSALHLQRKLELLAIEERKKGGKYIRPIVLFQAQPKTKDDNTTFEKLKRQLLNVGIPEEQIKIKTANIDELKDVSLSDESCPVRYIITINALKEGWDCPFAYVLASLADKSSAVDVEQILGRVLRQPYVMRHSASLLNVSYVLTASAKFNDTLQNIVEGLQASGFSEKDYRKKDVMSEASKKEAIVDPMTIELFPEQVQEHEEEEIDSERISYNETEHEIGAEDPAIADITSLAEQQSKEMESEIERQKSKPIDEHQFMEMGDKVKRYKLIEAYSTIAKEIELPQFFIETPKGDIFGAGEAFLNQELLLKGFKLASEDTKIDFEENAKDLYKVDIHKQGDEDYSPRFEKIANYSVKDDIVEYILAKPKESQIKDIAYRLVNAVGNMYPISDHEIRLYIERIIASFSAEQFRSILTSYFRYATKIKEKVKSLADAYAEQQFNELLTIGKVSAKPTWKFPEAIVPGPVGSSISKSLYEREGIMNDFETSVISDISSLPNITFWHRNLGRGKGFSINGFKSRHYPDFILHTRNGNIIILETKGDDRDNPDSASKRRLGEKWANLSGVNYYYFMVYNKISPEGAFNRVKARELISRL